MFPGLENLSSIQTQLKVYLHLVKFQTIDATAWRKESTSTAAPTTLLALLFTETIESTTAGGINTQSNAVSTGILLSSVLCTLLKL